MNVISAQWSDCSVVICNIFVSIGNSMISSGIGINATSDTSKLLYVISRAGRRVKFETILKYHEWYLYQISLTNHAITYTNKKVNRTLGDTKFPIQALPNFSRYVYTKIKRRKNFVSSHGHVISSIYKLVVS